jgi:hypothetical protein
VLGIEGDKICEPERYEAGKMIQPCWYINGAVKGIVRWVVHVAQAGIYIFYFSSKA